MSHGVNPKPYAEPYNFHRIDGPHEDIEFVDPKEGCEPVTVAVFRSEDGTVVVQIDWDSDQGEPRMRVNINDGAIFDRDIHTDYDYGDDLDR